MQEPWAGVVSHPTNGNIITGRTQRHDITTGRIGIVIDFLASAPHNIKRMLYMTVEFKIGQKTEIDNLRHANEMGAKYIVSIMISILAARLTHRTSCKASRYR